MPLVAAAIRTSVAVALLVGAGLFSTSAGAQTSPPAPKLPAFTRIGISGAPSDNPMSGLPGFAILRLPKRGATGAPISTDPSRRLASPGKEPDDEGDDDVDDEEGRPYLPGRIDSSFAKVPRPVPESRQTRTSLGPHLEPVKEFQISDQVALGVLGHTDRVGVKLGSQANIEHALRSPSSAIRAKDAGVGLSIEFRLGK